MVALQRFGTGESPVASAKLNLVVDALTGQGNTPVNHGAVNDPVNYALTVRNQDAAGKAAILYAPNGTTVLLQVTASGVLASPDGVAAAAPVLTTGSSIPASQITAAAWTTFTPTMTQGVGLTLSTATGRYTQIGKTVIASVDITINSAGTAATQMAFGGLPVASLMRGNPGSGLYFDTAPGATYPVVGVWATSTSVQLFAPGGSNSGLGVAPAVTAAAGDTLRFTLIYEAA